MNLSSRNELATEKFIWSIKNFSRIPARAGISYKSFIIHKNHARKAWRFVLKPSSDSNPNYLAAYFKKALNMFDPIVYNCSISVGSSDNAVKSFKFSYIDLQTYCIGVEKCIRRDFIENILKGSLTVQCEVTEVFARSYFPSMIADFENLSSDLADLLCYPVFYDFTVRIQQFNFYLHSYVLFARCRHLSQLFGYQSFNEMPRYIQMDNISPDAFRQLIHYLYSGKLERSNFSPESFMYADIAKLQSLKQQLYEKVQEYCTRTEIATQTLIITWNLKEIEFRKENAVPFVQMFQLSCCMTHLAVQMGICKDLDGDKCIDISFKVFLDSLYKPVSALCVMTLFIDGKVSAYKTDRCVMDEAEEWHFQPFVKLSDIPESNDDYSSDICLTAEISLSDGCPAYNNVHTKSRLFTYNTNVDYPESLGSDMKSLLSSEGESDYQSHDITLKSVDNCFIPSHRAILCTRWPAIVDLLKNWNGICTYLPLDLHSGEIQILLDYIYTGSISSFNLASAETLLRANCKIGCPPYLVQKCTALILG